MIYDKKWGFETKFITIGEIGFDCRRVGDEQGQLIHVNVLRMFNFFVLLAFLSYTYFYIFLNLSLVFNCLCFYYFLYIKLC